MKEQPNIIELPEICELAKTIEMEQNLIAECLYCKIGCQIKDYYLEIDNDRKLLLDKVENLLYK